MNPKISIIMPVYNRDNYLLKEAIVSALNQSFDDFELIIVNDASTDNTETIINSFKDKRIKQYVSDHNHGEYWSTNEGIGLSKGKYLTWLHSDDRLATNSIKIRFETLEKNPDVDFVHGDIVKIDEQGKIIEELKAVDWPKKQILLQFLDLSEKKERKYLIHHTTVMMKKGFFDKTGSFDTTLPFAGDIDWLIRAIKLGNFLYINHVLYEYRSHPNTRRVLDVKNGVDKEKIVEMIIRRYI